MNVDGFNRRKLSNSSELDSSADFSPKGDSIVFQSRKSGIGTLSDIYTIKIDGTFRKVVNGSNISNDRKYFVYERYVNDKSGIYVYNFVTKSE